MPQRLEHHFGGAVVATALHRVVQQPATIRREAAASRLFALLDQNFELRSHEGVAPHAAGWRDASARLVFARQLFNDAAAAYNEAIALFPTRLLTRVFRFRAAGRI